MERQSSLLFQEGEQRHPICLEEREQPTAGPGKGIHFLLQISSNLALRPSVVQLGPFHPVVKASGNVQATDFLYSFFQASFV